MSESKEAGLSVPPLVNVELAGVVQSTWKFQISSCFDRSLKNGMAGSSKCTKRSGAPAGGAVGPSRSEGSMLWKLVSRSKYTSDAAEPASIAVRSNATAPTPTRQRPHESSNWLTDM